MWTQTLRSGGNGQLDSTHKPLPLWKEEGVIMIAKGYWVIHIQLQCAPCFRSTGTNKPNIGNSKD